MEKANGSMIADPLENEDWWAYVVGASKERLPAIRARLLKDGIQVCGHCDCPRAFRPPRCTALILLIADMGCHVALDRAREYCRIRGVPCVGGLWRSWSTTRERLASLRSWARPRRPTKRAPVPLPSVGGV